MKKHICILLMAVIIIGLVSGCSGEGNADEINIPAKEESVEHGLEMVKPLITVYEGPATNFGSLNYSGEIYQMIMSDIEYKAENSMGYKNSFMHVIPETELYIYKNANDNWCAFSGAEQIMLDGFAVKEEDRDNVRNNRTGYLIGIFSDEKDAETAKFEYIAGTKYVKGESYPSIPTVVMNGRVNKNISYYIENDRYWISITDILETRDISWKDEGNGITYIWLGEEQWIPGVEVDNDSLFYNYATESDEFYVDMMLWSDNFKLLKEKGGKWFGDAEMISRVLGMEILVSEDLVVITSDPYDCPQEFYILNQNDEYIPFVVYQE